jgi:hypothetical protein
MHETSRHIIHASETLGVAFRTLEKMILDHALFCEHADMPVRHTRSNGTHIRGRSTQHSAQTVKALRFYSAFLANLQLRAQSFDERLRNEIKLVIHPVCSDREGSKLIRLLGI